MLKNSFRFKNVAMFMLVSVLFFSVVLLIGGSTAKADTGNVVRKPQGNTFGDGCTFNGTLMNTVIFVEFVDQNGNNVGWANGFNINIHTTNPNGENKGLHSGLVKNIDRPNADWRRDKDFSPGGDGHYENCDLRSINQNGMAKALNFTDQFHDVNEWKLACGYTQLGNKNRIFDITGSGVPSGIPGGWDADGWQRNDARIAGGNDANYANTGVHLKYRLKKTPPPPPPPVVNLTCSGNAVINVGQTHTFRYTASKSNSTAFYNGDITRWPRNNPATLNLPIPGQSGPGIADWYGLDLDSGTSDQSKPVNRQFYFDQRGWYPESATLVGPNYSKGCDSDVTINGWDVSASSSVDGVTTKVVLKNQTVTYRHRICNNGPAPLHKFINADLYMAPSGVDYTKYDLYPGDPAGKCHDFTRPVTLTETGKKCEILWFGPVADNNGNWGNGGEVCVYVVDPIANTATSAAYEKGTGDNAVTISVRIDNGGFCPPTSSPPFTILYDIAGLASGSTTQTYGGSNCSNISFPVNLNGNQLNNQAPGTTYPMTTTVIRPPQANSVTTGFLTILEVPFTRFYGNEVYSTNDSIKFNSRTNNPTSPFNGQGTVAQYAAFASNGIVLDTAAYRAGQPVPPNGLDSPNSFLSKKSSSVYIDVMNSLPPSCAPIPSGNSFAGQPSGCYTLNDSNHFGGTNIPILGTGDGFGAGASIYSSKQITVVNNTDKMFMITGDVQTDNQGVLLIVSKGDIVIDNNVKRVDAILITDGNIYTCGFAGFGPGRKVPQNQIDETCRVPLTINGALSAKTVDFRRVGGSRYLSNGLGDTPDGSWNCTSWRAIKNCGERGDMPFNTGKTAEIINFPAYLYWTKPFLKDESSNGAKVDAIFNMPPRL